MFSRKAKILKHTVARIMQKLPERMGFFAPKRSRILPLIGERIAPMIQPGRRRHPAREGFFTKYKLGVVGDQESKSQTDKLNENKDQYTEAERNAAKYPDIDQGCFAFFTFQTEYRDTDNAAARSPSTWTLIHPAPEAVLVAKIKQAKPAARNM